MPKRRGYGQFCPVAKAAEVLAERWTPLIVRELLAGSHRFSDLRRGLPLISPTVLSQRIKALQDADVLERRRGERAGAEARADAGWEYHLTPAGEALRPIIDQLGAWGRRWIRQEIQREDLDPRFLMWAVRQKLDAGALPTRRLVLEFEFRDGPARQRRWWIVTQGGDVDLCLKHPGYPVDLTISSAVPTLARIYLRRLDPRAAVSAGLVRLQGTAALVRSFPRWYARPAAPAPA